MTPAAIPPRIEELGAALRNGQVIEPPLRHLFTPGLYTREIFLPAGSIAVTKIHKTEHPFVISLGSVTVWTKEDGVVTLRAPHTGVTKPGTHRAILVHEDTIWSTFHPTPETDLEKIEDAIIEKHDTPFLVEKILKQLPSHDEVSLPVLVDGAAPV